MPCIWDYKSDSKKAVSGKNGRVKFLHRKGDTEKDCFKLLRMELPHF